MEQLCWNRGSDISGYEEFRLQGYNAFYSVEMHQTWFHFEKYMLLETSIEF
jgi:hypothetical protein